MVGSSRMAVRGSTCGGDDNLHLLPAESAAARVCAELLVQADVLEVHSTLTVRAEKAPAARHLLVDGLRVLGPAASLWSGRAGLDPAPQLHLVLVLLLDLLAAAREFRSSTLPCSRCPCRPSARTRTAPCCRLLVGERHRVLHQRFLVVAGAGTAKICSFGVLSQCCSCGACCATYATRALVLPHRPS